MEFKFITPSCKEACCTFFPSRISASPLALMIWLLAVLCSPLLAQDSLRWLTQFEEAKEIARKESKYVLIYFSGSDWCKPCMKMKREIFETPKFKDFAKEHLVCLLADFPRKRKNQVSDGQKEHNEKLAEVYEFDGIFPHVLLIDEEGRLMTKSAYQPGGPDLFINTIRPFFKKREKRTYKKAFIAMGSQFEVTAVSVEQTVAEQAIAAAQQEIARIEKMISSWDSASQTSAINRQAGIGPVEVDKELFRLIERSKKVSTLTNGAFDISFAGIDHVWRFDGSMARLPAPEAIVASVEKINYQNILLNEKRLTVFLKEKGMKIGFGAIGKGYAANKARAVMKNLEIDSGIVNAGGDLVAWGHQPGGDAWEIGIADPKKKGAWLAWLPLEDMAIVTSGNYERFALIDGRRYAHIIDPRSGYPVSGLKSVSIICPDTELADALATAVFVMGEKNGMHLINQLEQIEGIIVNSKDEMLLSDHLQLNYR